MRKIIMLCFVTVFLGLLTSCNSAQQRSIQENEKDTNIIFTIYSFDGKSESEYMINSLGHAWLSIDNLTNESIYLGAYEIEPNTSLYYGAWGSSAKWGICYNMEPTFQKEYGRYEGTISLSTEIDENQLNELYSFNLENDTWNIFHNCSWFAINSWNTIMEDEFDLSTYLIYTPTSLCKDLKQFDEYETNRQMTGAKEIFFYNESMERVVLELCKKE